MLRLFSPAKINLFLRIISKRQDGYHNLSSVFQTITLGDTLTIELQSHDLLSCSDPQLPIDGSNLVLKATELYRQKTGLKIGFNIHLNKQIPMQAGLGGGSSNAATTLWACNQLTKSNISLNTLKQWGGELGSDIPFFFSQGTAYCTGRGKNVYHLPALAARPLWIVKPSKGLSTQDVYRKLKLNIPLSEKAIQKDLDNFLSGTLPYFNDLETPAFELMPELGQLKAALIEKGFDIVLMTGSGSAFFCMGTGQFPLDQKLLIYPVHFVNRSLIDWYSEI